jgi:ABC-type phosphate transport system auxiliary subunit
MTDKPTYEDLEKQVAELQNRFQHLQEEEDALDAFFEQALVLLPTSSCRR